MHNDVNFILSCIQLRRAVTELFDSRSSMDLGVAINERAFKVEVNIINPAGNTQYFSMNLRDWVRQLKHEVKMASGVRCCRYP